MPIAAGIAIKHAKHGHPTLIRENCNQIVVATKKYIFELFHCEEALKISTSERRKRNVWNVCPRWPTHTEAQRNTLKNRK